MSEFALTSLAVKEAERLGHGSFCPEHLLLAVARGSSSAGEALRAAGLGAEVIETLLERQYEGSEARYRGILSTPAWHAVAGFARGFAAAQGREVEEADGVVAFLWTGWPFPAVDRDAVVAELRVGGVPLPSVLPPELDTRRWGEEVRFAVEDLDVVLRELPKLLADPSAISFNHDGEKAWVRTLEEVDLLPLVQRVLAEAR